MANLAKDLPRRLWPRRSARAKVKTPGLLGLVLCFIGDDNGQLTGRTVEVVMQDGKFENVPGTEKDWPS